jgi:hypothetical protein
VSPVSYRFNTLISSSNFSREKIYYVGPLDNVTIEPWININGDEGGEQFRALHNLKFSDLYRSHNKSITFVIAYLYTGFNYWDYIGLNGQIMKGRGWGKKRLRLKASCLNFLGGTEGNCENRSQNCQSLGQDFNTWLSEHELDMLTTWPRQSVSADILRTLKDGKLRCECDGNTRNEYIQLWRGNLLKRGNLEDRGDRKIILRWTWRLPRSR